LGGSAPADDGHETAAMLQAAQELFQLGHYDQAAAKYGKVAEMGGNSGRVQQRLGDCYRNLGKNDQSKSAYNRAINLFEAQIKQGHNVAGNQRGLESCESALKVLGG
jgi:tetratricopeptide (TPR) repeat protein